MQPAMMDSPLSPPCPSLSLSVAQIVPCTEAEGPGRRFALWFQGCPLRCPGCCNPEMLPFEGGTRLALADVIEQVRTAIAEHAVEGITLLGGASVGRSPTCRWPTKPWPGRPPW